MTLQNPRMPRFWSVLPGSSMVFNGNAPVAWTALDLTGFMGVKSGVVMLKIINGAIHNCTINMGMNGDGGITGSGISVHIVYMNTAAYFLVPVNAGIVEWVSSFADPLVIHALCWWATYN